MRRAEHVACIGGRRGAYSILMGRAEGKRSLGRPTHRWKDDIKMDLLEVGRECTDWIDFAQDRNRRWAHVNVVMNLQVQHYVGIS